MHNSLLRSLALAVTLALTVLSARSDIVNGFDVWSIDYGNNYIVPGRLYIPPGYNPANSYPLVVFYHGRGERGSNNLNQINGNIDNLVANAGTRNFFIYAPQIGSGAESWWDGYIDQTIQGAAAVTAKYNIDRKRIYVTGLSMGGGGARGMIARYYPVVAAAVPICGLPREGSDYTAEFPKLVGKKIWQFHAADDNTVNVAASRNWVNLIRAADGGKAPLSFRLNVANGQPYRNFGAPYYTAASGHTFYEENGFRYTEYGSGDHFIWGWVYGDSNMYDWLLAQQLPEPGLQQGETAAFDFGLSASGTSPDNQGRLWTSLTSWSAPSTLTAAAPFVKIAGGRQTSVSLTVVQRFGGPFNEDSGISTPLYPDAVGKDGWITQPNASETSNAGTLRISGLAAGESHRVEIFGSIADNDWGGGRQTRYKIGSEVRDLNAFNNTGTTAVFESVQPSAAGVIEVKVFGKPGTTTGKAVINALTVTRTGTSAPSNTAPIVNAGPDQTTTLYDGIALSGTASDDGNPTGSTLSTLWARDSGPGTVAFANATALNTTASFSEPGTYVLRLTASDGALSTFDTVTVTVNEWKNIEIGTVPVAGSGVVTSGTAVVTGSGPTIWQNNDDFHFMFRPVSGDCTIVARMMSHPFQHWNSKAGIMFRGTLTRDASHSFIGLNPGGVESLYMNHEIGQPYSNPGYSVGTAPYWLKIVRVGSTVTASVSPDGSTWTEVGSRALTLSETAYVGFAVASAAEYSLTVVFDHITVTP